MIEGASDITRLIGVFRKLGIIDTVMDVTEGATYAMTYMGHKMRIPESTDAGDEFDDLSEEELRIMNIYDSQYNRWYDERLNSLAAEILLGDDDES